VALLLRLRHGPHRPHRVPGKRHDETPLHLTF
jgi:hypothetical protein